MFRTRRSKISFGAGVAVAAVAAAVLSGPPAHATIWPQIIVAGLNGDSGCELHGHAHNSPLQLYPCGLPNRYTQEWKYANPETKWFPVYGNRPAVELQLDGTDECANDVEMVVYLDSCVKGDGHELFWPRETPTAHNWWYLNAAESESHNANYYMTVPTFGNYVVVYDLPPGNGQRAEWYIRGS